MTAVDGPVREAKLTLELFHRGGANGVPRPLVDRLDSLLDSGAVDDYTFHAVAAGDEVLGQLNEWATACGVSLRGCFGRETLAHPDSGEPYDELQLPAVSLAEYRDEELWFVAPCRDRDTVYTVVDRLRALGSHR